MMWCVRKIMRNAVDWTSRRSSTKMKRKQVTVLLCGHKGKICVIDLISEEACQWSTMPRWEILNVTRTHKEIHWKLLPTVHSSVFDGCQDYHLDISESEGCKWIPVKLL